MELLKDAASVKETATELGYKNQHHFSREFKKHTGHAPSQPQTGQFPSILPSAARQPSALIQVLGKCLAALFVPMMNFAFDCLAVAGNAIAAA